MQKLRVVMPEKYDLVTNDTFQLFYRGIVDAPNPYCYDIAAVCEVGKAYPRYFEFTPEQEGEYKLEIFVYGAGRELLCREETILSVCAPKEPEKETNILCIGDSLTAGGQWVTEACRRLTGKGGKPAGYGMKNINFIGGCGSKVNFEGFGGWKWESFFSTSFDGIWVVNRGHERTHVDQHSIWQAEDGNLWQLETPAVDMIKFMRHQKHDGVLKSGTCLTHVRGATNHEPILIEDSFEEGVSPFLDKETKTIDFKKYCKKHNYSGIDVCYILLGFNGLHEAKVPLDEFCGKIVADGKTLVDMIHRDYPKAKVTVVSVQVPSVTGGMSQYGAKLPYSDAYGMTHFAMELGKRYEEWTKEEAYREFMDYVSLAGQFDSEYSYPAAPKAVNNRSEQTEIVGTNGLHPMQEGYMQVADAVMRNMVHALNNEFCRKNLSKKH